MQEQEQIDILCPKHGEKIISFKLSETGENQMSCLKCFTENEVTNEQLAQQLTDLRQNKILNLIELGSQSEKRLGSLKKVFLDAKEQFNKQIDNIIKTINDEITIMNENIKQETNYLKQPIQQLNLTQVSNHIRELRQQQKIKNDQRIIQDLKLKIKLIQQYLELFKSLNNIVQQGSDWKKQNEAIKDQQIVNKNPKIVIREELQSQPQPKLYKFHQEKKEINFCYAIAMDKDEKILVNANWNDIQIWDFTSDGTMQLKQTLKEHTCPIRCLCFSKKQYWFISGSDDQSIRIWQRNDNYKWICKQAIQEAHQHWVLGIVLNNNEDQFISCGWDANIKVWEKQNAWHIIQTLENNKDVNFLSFNHDCSLLASTGDDGIKIWENDKQWKLKQRIEYSSIYMYSGIRFIHKNELIASTIYDGMIKRFKQNNIGIFKLAASIQLNKVFDAFHIWFPIIYNEQLQLAIVRLVNQVYVLKYDNGQFIIQQIIEGDYSAGYLQKSGKYLILSDFSNGSLQIYY